MATVHISEYLDQRLSQFCERTGRSKTELVVEALRARLKEIEGLALVEEFPKEGR
jgi:predicted DNA-binding protein